MEDYMLPLQDTDEVRREVLESKCRLLSEVPGLVVEFDPHEAEMAGAFQETALSHEDAYDAVYDEDPLG